MADEQSTFPFMDFIGFSISNCSDLIVPFPKGQVMQCAMHN